MTEATTERIEDGAAELKSKRDKTISVLDQHHQKIMDLLAVCNAGGPIPNPDHPGAAQLIGHLAHLALMELGLYDIKKGEELKGASQS